MHCTIPAVDGCISLKYLISFIWFYSFKILLEHQNWWNE